MTTQRPRTLDPSNPGPLQHWLAATLGASAVHVADARVLSGGAVQENWRLDVEVTGGGSAGRHAWVLRTDAAVRISLSLDRASEYAVLLAAHGAGVPVAKPVARCEDPSVIGAPFLIQALVPGTAQARKLVRDPAIATFGPAVAADLGTALGRIHRLTPATTDLPFLTLPMRPPAKAEVQRLRQLLDGAGEARPALEYLLCWLDAHAPERRPLALVHGDFRTGNYLVDARRLTAVLDWEFAHWGDPHEDIGWFCARCWRFGADDREAGGLAPRTVFYAAYDAAAEEPVDPRAIPYWEVYALAKWAAVAVLQGDRYRKGGEASIELALTGLMAPEMELDALTLIEEIEKSGGLPWQ